MHEWMVDNGFTPHLVVDARRDGVDVPQEHVKDGKIVLNVSALGDPRCSSSAMSSVAFETRFGGVPRHLEIPCRRGARNLCARDRSGHDLRRGRSRPGRARRPAADDARAAQSAAAPPRRASAEAQGHQITTLPRRSLPRRECAAMRVLRRKRRATRPLARLEQLRVDQVAEAWITSRCTSWIRHVRSAGTRISMSLGCERAGDLRRRRDP